MRYAAYLEQEGKYWNIEFPDAPGCATYGTSKEKALLAGEEALRGWLKSWDGDDQGPQEPKASRKAAKGKELAWVIVPANVAIPTQLKWARLRQGLTQKQLAEKLKVTTQQVAKLEKPGANPSIETLEKVGNALGLHFDASWSV